MLLPKNMTPGYVLKRHGGVLHCVFFVIENLDFEELDDDVPYKIV